MENPFKKRDNLYSKNSLWSDLKNSTRQAGIKTTYTAMLLYFAYQRKDENGDFLILLNFTNAPLKVDDSIPLANYQLAISNYGEKENDFLLPWEARIYKLSM